ncbi:unnamed protein product, partial [Rotaria magnacalcarata]
TKRSKTVSTLKIGITTLFEGYNRERRRGKILYLGKLIIDTTDNIDLGLLRMGTEKFIGKQMLRMLHKIVIN